MSRKKAEKRSQRPAGEKRRGGRVMLGSNLDAALTLLPARHLPCPHAEEGHLTDRPRRGPGREEGGKEGREEGKRRAKKGKLCSVPASGRTD